MFRNLQDFIKQGSALMPDDSGKVTEKELLISVVVMLLEMARSDGHASPKEILHLVAVVGKTFEVEESTVRELVDIAEHLMANSARLDGYITAINVNFSPVQREELLGGVWRVLAADGKADKAETSFAVELRKKLDLTLEQAVRARQLAEMSGAPRQTSDPAD